ncbi:MAG TPA: PIN domain-containing protein [bacterium]|nr:PIN domain-containing protein [bacterium]
MVAEVLLDTSVWIDFFRKPEGPTGEQIIKHLKKGTVSTCGVVVFEVLQGAADPAEFAFLEENLKGLHFLEADAASYFEAGRTSYGLRKRGVTLPLSDILIATLAISNRQVLWTKDQHFKKIKALHSHFL